MMGTGGDQLSFGDNNLDLGLVVSRSNDLSCLPIAYKKTLKALICTCWIDWRVLKPSGHGLAQHATCHLRVIYI